MSYYGSDVEAAESDASFDDPTADLEIQAEADDPEGDLGDGAFERKRGKVHELDPSLVRSIKRVRG